MDDICAIWGRKMTENKKKERKKIKSKQKRKRPMKKYVSDNVNKINISGNYVRPLNSLPTTKELYLSDLCDCIRTYEW